MLPCDALCRLTTKSRLALSRQIGSDPGLKGLLRVYKDYYPEIIVGEAAKGRAAAFKVVVLHSACI